jgi:hypothetical protein
MGPGEITQREIGQAGPAQVCQPQFMPLELHQLAQALAALGCPADKSPEMAAQLDKRARQLSNERGQSYDAAMAHLLRLMAQGWAAPAAAAPVPKRSGGVLE